MTFYLPITQTLNRWHCNFVRLRRNSALKDRLMLLQNLKSIKYHTSWYIHVAKRQIRISNYLKLSFCLSNHWFASAIAELDKMTIIRSHIKMLHPYDFYWPDPEWTKTSYTKRKWVSSNSLQCLFWCLHCHKILKLSYRTSKQSAKKWLNLD